MIDRRSFVKRAAFAATVAAGPVALVRLKHDDVPDFRPFSTLPAETEFIESRGLTRDEICAVFGIPPSMITGSNV